LALIDLAADGTISREDLRAKLSGLDKEQETARAEVATLKASREGLAELEDLPEFAESLARDLPYLLDSRRVVRAHETVAPERTQENPLGLYTLAPDRISYLSEEEVEWREREAEDERAARYRAMYEDLGLRVAAHPDGDLEARWRFGEATLRKSSDTSKNKHATKYFHATQHPLVQPFGPGEDWIWCYVDEVVMQPR
jgi:hypothetical protein